jgi:hypothetical protein
MDDPEVARLLQQAADRIRGYASFFQWTDRDIAETGVVESLMESMEMRSAAILSALKSRGTDDPPDCEAVTAGGGRVGIEVTELVDEAAIEAYIAGDHFAYANWDADKVLTRLKEIVRGKDAPATLKGAPYDQYWLVIHCDETALRFEDVSQWISRMQELPTNLIDRAFLLISYRPEHQCYPYVELSIRRAGYTVSATRA